MINKIRSSIDYRIPILLTTAAYCSGCNGSSNADLAVADSTSTTTATKGVIPNTQESITTERQVAEQPTPSKVSLRTALKALKKYRGRFHKQEPGELYDLGLYMGHVQDDDMIYIQYLIGVDIVRFPAGMSDAGLKHVAQATQLSIIAITGDNITDRGLQYLHGANHHLHGANHLEHIIIWSKIVTNDGISELQAALPECVIEKKVAPPRKIQLKNNLKGL